MELEWTIILPVLVGVTVGILLWALSRFSLCQQFQKFDPYGVILPSVAICILPFILVRLSISGFEPILNLAPLGTLLLVIIAFLNYTWTQRSNSDKVVVEQAVLALERAYSILKSKTDPPLPPIE